MNRLVFLALTASVLMTTAVGQGGGEFTFDGKTFEVTAEEISQEIALLARLAHGRSGPRQIEQAWARVIRRKAAQHVGIKLSDAIFERMMNERHVPLRGAWMVNGKINRDRLAAYLSGMGFADLKSYEAFCRDEFQMELFLENEFPRAQLNEGAAWDRFQADNAVLKVRALVFSEETRDQEVAVNFDDPTIQERFSNWWNGLPDSIRRPYDDENRPAIETEALSVVFSRYTPDEFKKFFEAPQDTLNGESFADRTRDIVISPLHAKKIEQRWRRYKRSVYSTVLRTLPRGLTDEEIFTQIRPHLEREYRMIRHMESIWLGLRGSSDINLKAIGSATGLSWRHLPLARTDSHINDGELYGDHPIHMSKLGPGLYNNPTDPDNMGHSRYAQGVVDQPGGHASIFVIRQACPLRVLDATEAIKIKRARHDFSELYAWSEAQKSLASFGGQLRAATETTLPKKDITLHDVLSARGRAIRKMGETIPNAQWLGPFFVSADDKKKPDAVRDGALGRRVANALKRSIGRMLPKGTLPRVGDVLLPASCTNQRVGIAAEVVGVKLPTKAQFRMRQTGRAATEAALALESKRARTRRINLSYAWPNIIKKFKVVAPEFNRLMAQTLAPKKPDPQEATPPTRAETLVTRLASGRYRSLNPVTYRGQGEYNVLRFLLNPYLLQIDPDTLELLPYLAESLPTISSDGLKHTWTLREATWSDGKRVTTDDVLFTWGMIQHERVPTPQVAGAIGDVTKIEKIDDVHFTVHYKKRYFRAATSFGLLFGLAPNHSAPSDPDEFARTTKMLGCGPYRITEWNEKEVVFDRVSNWWGNTLPRFKNSFRVRRIVHRFVSDNLQLALQLRNGEIDLAALGGADDFLRWQKETSDDDRFESTSYYLDGWSYIGWNCEDPLFADKKVRRALACLSPRREVNKNSHGGLARPVSGPFPVGSPYADPTIQPIEFSYRRAEALLTEAGWTDTNGDGILDRNGADFRFELLRPKGENSWMRIIDVYRQRLAQIGIQMTIRQVDFRTLLSVCPRHDFQAYAIIWRVDTVGTDLYDLFHSSQTKDGNNWQNLKSPSIDKLLDEFRSTRDEARRVELGQSIHRAVMEEQPICFLFSSPSCIVWNRRVKGVQSHPLGLREWDMYLAPKKK